jgi:hypothetical protein
MVIRGSISFVLVYACFSASSNLAYLGMEQEILCYLVKHGAYLYRFLIIYAYIGCHIIILEQYLRLPVV